MTDHIKTQSPPPTRSIPRPSPAERQHSLSRVRQFIVTILSPEADYYGLAVIYGIGISLLSLATPISVQMLINTVANTGLTTPLVMLSCVLFLLLALSGLLNALRIHLMDLFARHFYARMVSEIALRSIYAVNPFFEDRGNGALFNRYFDIIIVAKTLPYILIGGFTVLLQVVVGLVLVSMYHPLFLAFSITVALLVWLVWSLRGPSAMASAVELSHRKHAAAAWLEGLGGSNGYFKSERHIDHALQRTEDVTAAYMQAHRRHFFHHFSQTLSLMLIYALASALLLGLGGYLVIQGQLSLGQLVAAELVLSVAFFGVSQLGLYLTYFYDLCGAIDELSLFYEVEQERFIEQPLALGDDASLHFAEVRGAARSMQVTFNLDIACGARVLAHADNHAIARLFTNLLKRHEPPQGGLISVGNVDLTAMRIHNLRQEIMVLDRPNFTRMSIREYLLLSTGEPAPQAILEALDAVGLRDAVVQLADGLDTVVAATGWPLSITETMQLKLAAAVIAQPRILVLNELYDALPETCLAKALDRVQANGRCTVILFSNRQHNPDAQTFIHYRADRQTAYDDFDTFRRAAFHHTAGHHTAPPTEASQHRHGAT